MDWLDAVLCWLFDLFTKERDEPEDRGRSPPP